MKKISSKKSLTRKVLCSIMAAGMMGIAGTAFAAEYNKTIVPDQSLVGGLEEGSSVAIGNLNDNITVNVNTACVSEIKYGWAEFIGAANFANITWNLGGEGKVININVDGSANEDAEAIGVLADKGATINIKGSTTIKTFMEEGEYGRAIVAENGSKINITGDTIKLYGDVEATTGGNITLTGKTVTGDYIRLHNDYDFNPGYSESAHNSLTITADNITFKDYEGLSAEGMDEKDVARDSGQPIVHVNNGTLTMAGNVTISNAEGAKILQADPIGKDMEYYALRATDGSQVTLGKDSSSTVSITGDVVVEGLPWIDTEDRPDPHTIPTDGSGKESYLTVNGAATVDGNVVVMHGSEVTFANSAKITGRIWNGIDAGAAEEGEIGYMHSNIGDGGARKDGGILTVNGGAINGTVFTGGGAETVLKNVTITTDTKIENDALTIENATAELTNTTINGGLSVRSGFLTMIGGAIKGIARSEMHDGDFEKTEIDIQTGTAELTNTNINAVILVGMPGEDPDVYPTESSKLVLNATNDTTKYTPEYILVGPKGTVEIKGGTLEANNLKKMTSVFGETSRDGGIVLNGGTVSTMSGQIFEKGIDTTSEETAIASTDAGAITNKVIAFTSGTLALNDSLYTDAYLTSAISAMNNKNVEIVMNGKLVEGKVVVEEVKLEELNEKAKNPAVYDDIKVDAPAGSEQVEIGAYNAETGKGIIATGVGSIDLTGNESGVVNINKNFTLTGGEDGEIVKGAETVNVYVGKDTALNVGKDNGKNENKLKGNLNAGAGSTVNVKNNTKLDGDVNARGSKDNKANVNVNNGALHANEMALEHANLHSAVQAAVNVKQLTVAGETNITGNVNVTGDKEGNSALKVENGEGTVINIGEEKAAGVVVADNANLNGATLFLDPASVDGIDKGSKFATKTTDLDGKYVAGRNSVITFGSTDTTLAEKAFANTKLDWNEVGAAVYIADYITLKEKGALVVNGGLDKAPTDVKAQSVTFADKSMLMVANAEPGFVAIKDAKEISVSKSSKLMLIGAADGETYTVFGDAIEAENKEARWAYENVLSDEIAMTFVSASEEEGAFAGYKAKLDSLAAIYGDSVTAANVLDAARVDKDNKKAQDFFAAVGKDYGTKEARAKALNNVTTVTAQAGVASSAIVANAEVATAIGDHLSVGAAVEEGGKGLSLNKENGSAVWAKLIHKKADVDGLKVGSIGKADYDVKQNGIVAGLDFVNTEEKAFGVAITYMDGKVTGAAAKNDTENYGLSVYGKKKVGKAAIIADLSYIHGENDIKAGTVTAKPKSDALSLGVKAETAIKAGAGQFVPYVGARVTRLGIGDYKDSIGIKHDSDVENLFNIPVGIKYSANIQKGNWTMRPTVDLGYVFNVGNKDGQETVSYGGTSNSFSYEMVDKSNFVGALGFEMENKNVAYNLGYQYTKGNNTKAHKYMLGFKVKF